MSSSAIQKSDQRFTCANATLHSNIRHSHPLRRHLDRARILSFSFLKTKHTCLLSKAPKIFELPGSGEYLAQNTSVLSCDGTNTFLPTHQCFLPEGPPRTGCAPVYASYAFEHDAYLQPSGKKSRYSSQLNSKLLSSYRHYTASRALLSMVYCPFDPLSSF